MTQVIVPTQIKILAQEPGWIAVEKPAGIAVHNQENGIHLLEVLEKQLNLESLFPVHRLDKETSGLQVLALDGKTAAHLAQQFQNRSVQKFYQGIAAGQLPSEGLWDQELTDQAEGWKNPAGLAENRLQCETLFKALRHSHYFTWLEFQIMTGRQHQIRKHCALAGRALIGDPRYGNPKYNRKISEIYRFNRMALHCSKLIFENGQELVSPPPNEFQRLFPDEP